MQMYIFLLLPSLITGANILFLNTWQSKSHGRTMMYLAEELVRRGHNVTMYSQVIAPIGAMGKGVTALESRLPAGVQFGDPAMVSKIFWFMEMSPLIFEDPHDISYQYLNALKEDENLLRVLGTPYDLALLDEMFAPAQTAIALKLKETQGTKLGIFSTTDLFGYSSSHRSLSRNPATFPSSYTKGHAAYDTLPERFYTRLFNSVDAFLENIMFNWICNKYFVQAGAVLEVKSSLGSLYDNNLITFTDYPTRYGGAVPRSVDYISVSEHCEESGSLKAGLKTFVEDPASKGTIYVAFGSIVNWQAGPPHVIETFVNVFNRLSDYRVIWSYTGPELHNASSTILPLKWAPQNDILAHPKTVLFFTHGGLKSLREGICSNTPLLFLPFFADQAKNAAYAIQMHLAEAIYKGNIEEEALFKQMTKALKNPELKRSVSKYASHFTDNPMHTLELGAFWAEKVIRQGSLPLARIRGRDLSWLDYFHIESLATISLLLYIIA